MFFSSVGQRLALFSFPCRNPDSVTSIGQKSLASFPRLILAKQILGSVSVFLWLFNGDNHVLLWSGILDYTLQILLTKPCMISYNHPKDPSTCVFFVELVTGTRNRKFVNTAKRKALKLAKIPRLNVVIGWKLTEIELHKVTEFYRRLYGGASSCPYKHFSTLWSNTFSRF